jgi:NADH dehydrogenase
VVLINPTDYSLYLPLLPEVAAGILNPRRVSVPLAATLPGVRLVLGAVEVVDLDARLIVLLDPEGQRHTVGYDQLLLAVGSVNRLLPILGVAEHAHGFRSVAEAVYLRDHLVRQLELAATSDDPAERAARCTFVVVGAGYTGTEVAAHGQLLTRAAARQRPSLAGQRVRWLLLDLAPRVLPELDRRLSATAGRVLRKRGVEVRLQTTVQAATAEGVRLSDGEFVATRSLVWCGGAARPADRLAGPADEGRPAGGGRAPDRAQPPGGVGRRRRGGGPRPHPAGPAHPDDCPARPTPGQAGRGQPGRLPRPRPPPRLSAPRPGLRRRPGRSQGGDPRLPPDRDPHQPGPYRTDWLLDALLPKQTIHLGLVRGPAVPLGSAAGAAGGAAGSKARPR